MICGHTSENLSERRPRWSFEAVIDRPSVTFTKDGGCLSKHLQYSSNIENVHVVLSKQNYMNSVI